MAGHPTLGGDKAGQEQVSGSEDHTSHAAGCRDHSRCAVEGSVVGSI